MTATQKRQVTKTKGKQYVVFLLGETQFGVEIDQVLRIIRLTPITRIPRAPSFLEGVINYRGQAIPVVDLNKRLALAGEKEYGYKARILIVNLEAQSIGMLVDAVTEIVRLPDESIEPAPEMAAQVNGVYLEGIAHYRNRLLVLLDLERVLTIEDVDELDKWQTESEHDQ
ncbi:MAG: chemotaxis protein CheW [Chloroflexota bacterium]|nr:chemotaxis protein CheW [Chloroflexota bacterium]